MTGVIILAAGESKRLGEAKQNLVFRGKSLLHHSIETAVKAAADVVIVVVGANHEKIASAAENKEIIFVQNNEWHEGMSSSIRAGLTYLLKNIPDLDDVILMVCDQPFVDEKLLDELIKTRKATDKTIVACTYNNVIGVPVLFDKIFFDELLTLKGEEGGKKILQKHPNSVGVISFNKGYVDIDTAKDYKALQQAN